MFCEHLASPSRVTGAIKTIPTSPRQNAIPFSDLQAPSHTSLHHLRLGSCDFPASPLWALHRDMLCYMLLKTGHLFIYLLSRHSQFLPIKAGMSKSKNSKWVLLDLQRKIALSYQSHPWTSVDSPFYRSSCAAKEKSPAI